MAVGALLCDLRKARGWSQRDLAVRLSLRAGQDLTRDKISRWEHGQHIPSSFWLDHFAAVLDVPAAVLSEEAKADRVNRREFLSLAVLTAAHGKVATEVLSSVAGRDAGPLATVQTTHGTDLVIAALADRSSQRCLRRWMADGDHPVLRVNAAGILAKLPGQDAAADVVRVLIHDGELRRLYTTAVLSRTCMLDWPAATRLADVPSSAPASQVSFLASRLANEALNPRDAGARWCSATMLRELSPMLR